MNYADKVFQNLKDKWIRVKIDDSSDSLNKKIRNAEWEKINYILVVWEQEEKDNSVSVRNYKTKEQTVEKVENFINRVKIEVSEKSI